MENMVIWYYLAGINFVTFLVYGADKRRAVRHLWRIPESTLLGLAAFGGAAGALAGMYVFRHKIRKPKFKFGVPLLLAAELIVSMFIFWQVMN